MPVVLDKLQGLQIPVFEIVQSIWDILCNYNITKYRIDIQLHFIYHTAFLLYSVGYPVGIFFRRACYSVLRIKYV